jgi:heme/copper-type cytochrome/quinol oxidase subunit 3
MTSCARPEVKAQGQPAATELSAGAPAAGRLVAFRSPWEPAQRTTTTGVVVGCVSMATWFVPLFAGVIHLRFNRGDWVDEIVLRDARTWAAAGALLLACTALALGTAARTFAERGPRRAGLFVGLAVLAGAGSIASQVRGYAACARVGVDSLSGTAGSLLFGVAGLNILFASVGIIAMALIAAKAAFGSYHPARPWPVVGWRIYFQTLAALSVVGLLLAFCPGL